MTNSPIKTKLVNLSERPFIASISSHTRIHLNPKGTQGDSITLNGDVFTQADRTPIAEALMESVLSRRIALYYSIDKVAEVTTNCVGNFNSSARLCDLIACFDLHPVKVEEEEKPEVEELTAIAPEKKEEPKAEEPAKEEEKSTEEAEPVQEPVKVEEEEKPEVEEPVTEPVTQEPEEVKPAKKKRQIKIN